MGRYRDLALENLQKHRPHVLNELRSRGELESHLDEVESQAEEMFESLHTPMYQKAMKEQEFLKRLDALRAAHDVADEIVLKELILLPDPETERAMRQGGY